TGISTRPISPSTVTRYVLSGSQAGPRNTAPVQTLNWEPCHGHVTVEPSSEPSDNGPCLCVHFAWVAQKPPSVLNTAQSPTSRTAPAGRSLIRNSLSSSCARSVFIQPLQIARDHLCESLDEIERLLGDLPPAGVDRQRVPATRHLDDLGHALIALLLFVSRV